MNQENSNFFEKITFAQTDLFLKKVYGRRIEVEDIYDIPKSLDLNKLSSNSMKHWQQECITKRYSLWMLIINQFIGDITQQGVVWLFCIIMQTFMPLLIYYTIGGLDYMSTLNLFFLLIVLLACMISYLLSFFHVMHEGNILFLKIKYSIMTLIQDKTTKNKAVQNETIGHGKILNVMFAELEKLLNLTMFYHMPWLCVISLLINGQFLQNRVGLIPTLVGLFWSISGPFTQSLINNIWQQFKIKILVLSDIRTNEVDQFIKGILTIKALLLENQLANKIKEVRRLEFVEQVLSHIFLAMNNSNLYILPQISLLTLFGFQTYQQQVESISIYEIQFVLMILSNLKMIIALWLNYFLKSQVNCDQSFNRVKDVLINGLEEILIENLADTNGEVIFDNYSAKFRLSDSTCIFENISLTQPQGKLHIISGPVGSGKTTLLLSILNEMQTVGGRVHTPKDISTVFCSQEPWIMHESLRSNILMDKELDEDRLQLCIDLTRLEHDIQMLQDGIKTEIGDNGVNLSGGQKSRVQLCRAIQSDSDLQVLDDPFSSLDPIVGQQIFNDVILKHLKGKTVILVTHQIAFFKHADTLTFLDRGALKQNGNYIDLKEQITEHYDDFIDKEHVHVAEEANSSVDKKAKFETIVRSEMKSGNDIGFLNSVQNLYKINGNISITLFIIYLISVQQLQNQVDFQQISFAASPQERLLTLIILTLSSVTLVYFRSIIVLIQTNMATFSTFDRMIDSVTLAKQEFFISNPSGRIINRFTKDTQELDELMLENLDFVQRLLLLIGGMLVAVILNAPQILIIFPIQAVLMWYVIDMYEQTSLQVKDLDSRTKSPINTRYQSDLRGSVHLKASNSLEKNKEQWQEILKTNIKTQNIYQDIQRWFGLRLDAVTFLSLLFLLVVGIFARDYVSHSIISYCISQMYQIMAVTQLCYKMMSFTKQFLIAQERMDEQCNLEPESVEVKQPIEINSAIVTQNHDTKNQVVNNEIKVSNLRVRQRDDLPFVLHGLNFECLMQNAKIAIVGRTGSGKSSFLLSLLRMNQAMGSIQVGNVDILQLEVKQARNMFSQIPQEPFLIEGTLRDNLDPFHQHSDDKLVHFLIESKLYEALNVKEEMANSVQLLERNNSHNIANTIPFENQKMILETKAEQNEEMMKAKEQLFMKIALNGMNLSTGQRQLVALIRAVLKNAPVVLLDEATANVDFKADQLIQQFLRKRLVSSTLITIAHRINTIKDQDWVVLLENGKVKEQGTIPQLLDNKGKFYELYNSQN